MKRFWVRSRVPRYREGLARKVLARSDCGRSTTESLTRSDCGRSKYQTGSLLRSTTLGKRIGFWPWSEGIVENHGLLVVIPLFSTTEDPRWRFQIITIALFWDSLLSTSQLYHLSLNKSKARLSPAQPQGRDVPSPASRSVSDIFRSSTLLALLQVNFAHPSMTSHHMLSSKSRVKSAPSILNEAFSPPSWVLIPLILFSSLTSLADYHGLLSTRNKQTSSNFIFNNFNLSNISSTSISTRWSHPTSSIHVTWFCEL